MEADDHRRDIRYRADAFGGADRRLMRSARQRGNPRVSPMPDLARERADGGSSDPRRETLRAIQWRQTPPLCLELPPRKPSWPAVLRPHSTGRTYGRKRTDPKSPRDPCNEGVVHIWIASPAARNDGQASKKILSPIRAGDVAELDIDALQLRVVLDRRR